MDATTKDQALEFLKELETTLNRELPGPTAMESWIRSTVAAAKTDDKQKHLRLPEAAFLNGQALPILFELLKTSGRLSTESAQRALLNEYHRTTPNIARQSPIRWELHPFRKILSSPSEIYRGWTNAEKRYGLSQSGPDFSLRDPFPHSILFEGNTFPAARWNSRNDSWSRISMRPSFTAACRVSPLPRGTQNGSTTTPVSWLMTPRVRGRSVRRGQHFLPKLAGASGKAPTCTS